MISAVLTVVIERRQPLSFQGDGGWIIIYINNYEFRQITHKNKF